MEVTLKLYASLADFLPEGSGKNSIAFEVTGQDTINTVLNKFNIPEEKAHLVLLNGTYQETSARDNQLNNGDTIAIWPPVAGG